MYKHEFFYLSKTKLCCPIYDKEVKKCFNCNREFTIGENITCTIKIDGIHVCEKCYNTLDDGELPVKPIINRKKSDKSDLQRWADIIMRNCD